MNGGIVQSTLRELKGIVASRNLWLTFGAVVVLFAFTGPFGTMEDLRFLPRLGYWFVLHGLAWSAALVCAVLGDILLGRRIDNALLRMMIGAVLAAIPIGAIIEFMQFAWFAQIPTPADLSASIGLAVPLCIIFCAITYMTMSAEKIPHHSQTAAVDAQPADLSIEIAVPPLLRRLKPENRGQLHHLSVEDHYTRVRTANGTELILLRFSDALGETGATAGMQVHRSHWVADDFVAAVNRANGKLSLMLADGSEIPVSRTHAAEVRARFG